MKTHEIMTSFVRCVRPNDTLVAAATVMRDHDVGAVPVCDPDKRPIALLTDRDIALRAAAAGLDPNQTKVKHAMSPSIVFVFDDQEVETAAWLMQQYQVRRLPVVDREHQLVGIVSLADIAARLESSVGGVTLKQVSRPGFVGSETSDNIVKRTNSFHEFPCPL